MTDHAPPPPVHPVEQDPKAAAKAAKAYAKATRPWYKKKRWIISLAFVALIAVSAAVSGGGDDGGTEIKATQSDDGSSGNDKASDSKADKGDKGAVGTKGNPAPRGTAVQNKSAKYQILGVTTAPTVGSAGVQEKAAGKFVIIDLSVTNVKDETIQFSTSDVVLQVGGTAIEAEDDLFYLDDVLSYDDISPGLTKRGKVIFDVDPKQAGKGVLKAQAMLSTDEAVYLALG